MSRGVLKTTGRSVRLSEASMGREYVVVSINCNGVVKRRILDMGIIPGAKIRVLRTAPLGDPLEVIVSGFPISIRKSEAACIEVIER